uniref:Uncharacterized protein n=1 Tax=Parascaris univalens TaxID=6257 RepID=A0A915AV58_PARUN
MRACKLCTFFARLLLLAEGSGCVFGANGGLLAPIHVEFPASEITHWADEAEMRKRMKGYAERIFSHHYHLRRNKTLNRPKRDGGILSGPLATAVVSGMIGMTAKAVSDLTAFHPFPSDGGCKWFGTAPLCNYPCPPEYDYIRRHNGRCSYMWFTAVCKPDPSFGEPCSTILGSTFHKRFCCKSDPNECTWSGRWMGANTAHNIYCRYDADVGRCGALQCSINHYNYQAQNSSDIYGDRCDQLSLFGLNGKATCGYVAWFDESGELVNSWYKTN